MTPHLNLHTPSNAPPKTFPSNIRKINQNSHERPHTSISSNHLVTFHKFDNHLHEPRQIRTSLHNQRTFDEHPTLQLFQIQLQNFNRTNQLAQIGVHLPFAITSVRQVVILQFQSSVEEITTRNLQCSSKTLQTDSL